MDPTLNDTLDAALAAIEACDAWTLDTSAPPASPSMGVVVGTLVDTEVVL